MPRAKIPDTCDLTTIYTLSPVPVLPGNETGNFQRRLIVLFIALNDIDNSIEKKRFQYIQVYYTQ